MYIKSNFVMVTDSEGSPYPPHIQRFIRGRENSTNADALQPMLAPIRNIAEQGDLEQFEQQQLPRRLQLPPPPAMQPDPDLANPNVNVVQIPRAMMNVAVRQQHIINADNLVSQDSNGSSGTGHEDSGTEHRLDRHADEQPGPSNAIPSSGIAAQAETSSSNNIRNSSTGSTITIEVAKTTVPYKLCILKDDICKREIEKSLKDVYIRSRFESMEYNKESGITDYKRSKHDYAKSKGKSKTYSTSDRSVENVRHVPSSTNEASRARRDDRDRTNRNREQNQASRPTSNGQPRRRYLMRDDDDEEDNANAEDNDDDQLDTSDCSLDESDFSSSVSRF